MRLITQAAKLAAASTIHLIVKARFASGAGRGKLQSLMAEFEGRLGEEALVKDEREEGILRNYMELTEESYLQHLLQESKTLTEQRRRVDPSIILMALPTLEKPEAVREHLLLLFPHLPALSARELLLFLEYLLAQGMTARPKVPPPKALAGCEGLLVILGELYGKDFLIEWLKQVPLYSGSNTYMLAMGAFSIISGLSSSARSVNSKLIERCFTRVRELFQGEDSQARTGVILLALQSNLNFAEELLLIPYCLQFREVDGIKISLLVIELDRYMKQHYQQVTAVNPKAKTPQRDEEEEDIEIDQGVDRPSAQEELTEQAVLLPGHFKFKLQGVLLRLVRSLTYQDWKHVLKLHTLVRLFGVLQGKKLEGPWLKFSEKLFNVTAKKEQVNAMTNLSNDQLLTMLQVLQRMKINKPPLVKALLVVLSQRLDTAEKEELVRLARCLVTYVRLCEDYLLHFRLVVERRKFIFSREDIDSLNLIFRRVQVLFPKPLAYE